MTNNLDKAFEERRADPRFDFEAQLTIKIVFSSENPGLLGKTLDAASVDASASGMKILFNRPILIDSVLDVWVTKEDRKYFLTGNIRWCNEDDKPGQYQAGLVFRERTDTITDLKLWRKTFE